MDFCILTATMGNRTRARELWLRNETVTSAQLYPDYKETNFAPHSIFPLDRLLRLPNGAAIVAITGDEADPAATLAFAQNPNHFWNYKGSKLTQYWKKPIAPGAHDEVTAVVNARHVYWGSRQAIPHGIAFENFELREPFRNSASGQVQVFGITRRTPAELGFKH
jgi:hypothetical protein